MSGKLFGSCALSLLVALVACSSENDRGLVSTTISTSVAGTGGSMGTGGAGGSMGTGGAGGSMMVVNGCTKATAKAIPASITWDFSIMGNGCFKGQAPLNATFSGNFNLHPLVGGVDNVAELTSPITNHSSGVVTFTQAGTFGYFCSNHAGMKGAFFLD